MINQQKIKSKKNNIKINSKNNINKKAKYNQDEISYNLYKQKEFQDFKKTYLENK